MLLLPDIFVVYISITIAAATICALSYFWHSFNECDCQRYLILDLIKFITYLLFIFGVVFEC